MVGLNNRKGEEKKTFLLYRVHPANEDRPNVLCLDVLSNGKPVYTDMQNRFSEANSPTRERALADRCFYAEHFPETGDIIDTIERDYIIVGVEKRLQVDFQVLERFQSAMNSLMAEATGRNPEEQ